MDFNTILFGGIAILSFLIFFNLGKLGVYGAKLLGAGGRGYFLIIANKNTQNKIKKFFFKNKIIDLKFDYSGTKVIWKDI